MISELFLNKAAKQQQQQKSMDLPSKTLQDKTQEMNAS